ncbi:aminotransferase class IV [Clostridium uliginosum]|uniref:4-amino-4-deoxychorismate lyase n=1 Tax=Clostridium uliginosum TaxID=119641 RepID=A0A1I1I7I4_9CLOT|nr:aminotransferase class IV [Clostridium uliginosum]SFC31965.1 4-amino-4-deoxychorismate lyase [Clostridium uliginosum]
MRTLRFEEKNITLDESVIFGRGVFETILVNDKPVLFNEHIERLNKGIEVLDIGEKVKTDMLLNNIYNLKIKNCALKIIVTPKNIIMIKRDLLYKKEDYIKGFKLKISDVSRNSTSPLTYIKSINYIDNIMENKKCKKEGFNEVIFLNEKGYATEGSTSNIFMVKDKIIYTPEIKCGLLKGIVRDCIVKNNFCVEKEITIEELLKSDEVFITNSLIGIMKVTSINNTIFNNHSITNDIKEKYYKSIT